MVDSDRLIKLVKNYQCIWDPHTTEYHNKHMKDAAWNTICSLLIENWDTLGQDDKNYRLTDCRKRWNNIRDYYKKEIDQKKNAGTGQPKKRKKYIYYELLQFLRPVFERKDAEDNENNQYEVEPRKETSLKKSTSSTPSTSTTTATTSKTIPQLSAVPNKKRKTLTDFESAIIEALENKIADVPRSNPQTVEDDPDLMFLKSLLPDFKILTSSQKFDFKIGIMQLLKSITDPCSTPYGSCSYRSNHSQNMESTLVNIPEYSPNTPNCQTPECRAPTPNEEKYIIPANEDYNDIEITPENLLSELKDYKSQDES